MKFLDSNVFIYAYLELNRKLQHSVLVKKEHARKIIERINCGEKVVTSVVHISEVANILENYLVQEDVSKVLTDLLVHPSIEVVSVNKEIYTVASNFSKDLNVGVNDCLAHQIMLSMSIGQIYSFDTDFDKLEGIERVES